MISPTTFRRRLDATFSVRTTLNLAACRVVEQAVATVRAEIDQPGPPRPGSGWQRQKRTLQPDRR